MTEVVKNKVELNPLSLKESVHKFGRFTVVVVEMPDGKKGYGISRCSEVDDFKDIVGVQVAKGRAIKSLTNKLNGVHNHAWYLG